MTSSTAQTTPKQTNNRLLNILLGLLFLIPAALACGLSQGSLSIGTFVTSLQKSNLLEPSHFIGMANYSFLFHDKAFLEALKFTGLTVLVLLLVVAFIPALFAWGASLLGRGLRLTLRVLFTIPAAIFVPLAISLLWRDLFNPSTGILSGSWLIEPTRARQAVLFLNALYAFGLACGLGLILFQRIFRTSQSGTNPWKPFLIVWGIGLITVAAAALQTFTLSYVLTGGGPARATTNLLLYLYSSAFMKFNFGAGSAVATLLLVILVILGLAAGALAVFSNLRIELVPRSEQREALEQEQNKTARIVALLAALLIGRVGLVLAVLPFPVAFTAALKGNISESLRQFPAIGSVLRNTVLPPLIAVLFIQAPIRYLAALGIGGLRPLGKRSEWLLLLFCPWLFIGLSPLSLQIFSWLHKTSLLDTFIGLIPPLLMSVPMLVILTLFFKGQTARLARELGDEKTSFKLFFTRIILPSLPLAALLVFCGVFIGLFDFFWNLVSAVKPDLFAVSNVLWTVQGSFNPGSTPLIGSILLLFVFPLMVVFFLIFAVYQFFYLDRLALSTGNG